MKLNTRQWRAVRGVVLHRDGWHCQAEGPGCLGWANEVDHIIPRALGGGDDLTNLRAICTVCHRARKLTSVPY